ncbi:MAG TPA: hypothetical protein VGL05_04270 [Kribbella sp.]
MASRKNTPTTAMVIFSARGISRLGFIVSSPSDAAPSNPANARNPNTAAPAIVPTPVPAGRCRKFQLNVCPCGPWPVATRAMITMLSRPTSAAPASSQISRIRVMTRISLSDSATTRTSATSAVQIHSADPALARPSWLRTLLKNKAISAVEPVPMVAYAVNSAVPATNPARGPSVRPTSA